MIYHPADKRGRLKTAIAQELPRLEPLPSGPYTLIAADPPWSYNLREKDASHRNRTPYPNMSDDSIISLPVAGLAAKDCYLLLWVTNNHLEVALEAIKYWGFQRKGLHTWEKVTSKGSPHIGVGHYGRNCTEHFLVCTRGKPGSFTHLGLTAVPNLIRAPRGPHSAKPEQFYELCDRLHQKLGGKRIELFARGGRPGWDVWGLEAKQAA